jgi:hypothetical protein
VLELKESVMEQTIRSVIDESLSLLGEPGKAAVYFHLENSFDLKKDEIPIKLEKFADAIQSVFGQGSELLEAMIVKKLRESQNSELSKVDDFESIIAAAKQSFKKRRE